MEAIKKNEIIAAQYKSMQRTVALTLRSSAFYGNEDAIADVLHNAVTKLLTTALDSYDASLAGIAGFCGMVARREAISYARLAAHQSTHGVAVDGRSSESDGEDETFGEGVVLSDDTSEDNESELVALRIALDTLEASDRAFVVANVAGGDPMHDGTSHGKVSTMRRRKAIIGQLQKVLEA